MKPRIKPPSLPAPKMEIINLIDVLITLIAFFMFTTVFANKQQQLQIQLPEAAHAEPGRTTEKLVIGLTKEDRIFIDGRQLSREELLRFLQRKSNRDRQVAILADGSCKYEWLIKLLDTVKSSGLTRVSLNVRPPGKNN
jgi:biopolymer transport protein ExbD